jgi:hypothetical protein
MKSPSAWRIGRPGHVTLPVLALSCLLMAGGAMGSGSAVAAPVFSVSGLAGQNSNAGCASFGLPFALTSGDAAQGLATCSVFTGNSVAARASAGGLGAFASVQQPGGSKVTSWASATAKSRFMITGPDDTVQASLNLLLNASTSGSPGSSLFIDAGTFGAGEASVGPNGSSQRDLGLLVPSVDCDDCAITTRSWGFVTNVWHDFELSLRVEALSEGGQIDGMHTLTFATHGFVFNLPDGFSATIEGLGVTDNRFGTPQGTVAEPGSLVLASFGLVGLAGLAGRRRHRETPTA